MESLETPGEETLSIEGVAGGTSYEALAIEKRQGDTGAWQLAPFRTNPN